MSKQNKEVKRNAIEKFKQSLKQLCPKVEISVEPGGVKAGNFWLDIGHGEEMVTIEWRPNQGFGIYAKNSEAFGDRPQEIFTDPQRAARRSAQLLAGDAFEKKPWLRQLRDLYEIPQEEMARRMGVGQAAVSRFESRRGEIKLQMMMDAVAAMGGQVEIRVHFPDAEFPVMKSDSTRPC